MGDYSRANEPKEKVMRKVTAVWNGDDKDIITGKFHGFTQSSQPNTPAERMNEGHILIEEADGTLAVLPLSQYRVEFH